MIKWLKRYIVINVLGHLLSIVDKLTLSKKARMLKQMKRLEQALRIALADNDTKRIARISKQLEVLRNEMVNS